MMALIWKWKLNSIMATIKWEKLKQAFWNMVQTRQKLLGQKPQWQWVKKNAPNLGLSGSISSLLSFNQSSIRFRHFGHQTQSFTMMVRKKHSQSQLKPNMNSFIEIALVCDTNRKKCENVFGMESWRAKKSVIMKVWSLYALLMKFVGKLVLRMQLIMNEWMDFECQNGCKLIKK